MSKTIDIQTEKSRRLIKGVRAHMAELQDKGISPSELDDMEEQLRRLEESSTAADGLRAKLSAQVKTTNSILNECKQRYMAVKAVVRNNYPQERWADYGVTDKR